jgi:VanZ family protein
MITVSSTPGKKLPEVPVWNFDKFAHTIEFFIFSFLLFRYVLFRRGRSIVEALFVCLIGGITYGALDELHQKFIPNRMCTLLDFIADSLGVLSGSIIAYVFYRKRIHHEDD